MRPLQWWAESAPLPGGDRVKVFENLGAILVAPVAPVDTSLISVCTIFSLRNQGTYSLPNFSKLARADMSCQFKKRRYLCRHCLQNECTSVSDFFHFWRIFRFNSIFLTPYRCLLGRMYENVIHWQMHCDDAWKKKLWIQNT